MVADLPRHAGRAGVTCGWDCGQSLYETGATFRRRRLLSADKQFTCGGGAARDHLQ